MKVEKEDTEKQDTVDKTDSSVAASESDTHSEAETSKKGSSNVEDVTPRINLSNVGTPDEPNFYVKGLEKDLTTSVYEVTEGCPHKIHGSLPSKLRKIPKHIQQRKFLKSEIKVERRLVLHFSPEQCFSLVTNYLNFLSFLLKPNQDKARRAGFYGFDPCPQWEKFVQGSDEIRGPLPGCQFRYSQYEEGFISSVVNEIKVCEKTQSSNIQHPVYRFAYEKVDEETRPVNLSSGRKTLFVFSSFQGKIDKCHLYIGIREREVKTGGLFVNSKQKDEIDVRIDSHLRVLEQALRRKFSPKLPKVNSRVAIVGAGPSGLHMAHLLIEKGLPPDNITIYEKEEHIGGKTVTVKYNYDGEGDDLLLLNSPSYADNGELIYGNRTKQDFRKGGKPFFHELGTGYLSSTYFTTRDFIKDLEDKSSYDEPNLLAEVGPDTYAFEGGPIAQGNKRDLLRLTHDAVAEQSKLKPLFGWMPWLKRLVVLVTIFRIVKKYIRLQKDLMGAWHYTMPARRSRKQMEILMMPFEEFLHENGLYSLYPVWMYSVSGQGYGLLKDIPTFWAMTWLTPEQLDEFSLWRIIFMRRDSSDGFLSAVLKYLERQYEKLGRTFFDIDRPTKAMLIAGWETVWKRLLKVDGLEKTPDDASSRVKRCVNIKDIERSQCGQIIIRYDQGGKDYCDKHDFLIMAAPVNDPHLTPAQKSVHMKLNKEEEDILLSHDIQAARFRTTIIRPESNGHFPRRHMRVFIDPMLEFENDVKVKPGEGDVSLIRDSYKALQPNLCTKKGHLTDPNRDVVREKLVYQYVAPGKRIGEHDLDNKFQDFFDKYRPDMGTYEKIKKIFSFECTYFTHFGRKSLLKGNMWNLLERQGLNNTFFVHASSHFESVHHLMNYNKMMLAGLTGQLKGFEKPNDDKTIEEYERVENFFLNPLSYGAIGFLIAFCFSTFCNFLWSTYYIVSYPYMEYYSLRKERAASLNRLYGLESEMQQAVKEDEDKDTLSMGSNLPPYSNLDLDTYVSWLPLLKSYKNYVDHKEVKGKYDVNAENFFQRKLKSVESKLKVSHPGIILHEIKNFLECDFTDFRQLYKAFWEENSANQETFFQSCTENFIQVLEENIPPLYSFFGSFYMGYMLRFYVGFSYRIDDLQGGGLRIPQCKLLESAVKAVGVQAGRRVCLLGCKITVEEQLRSSKAKINFVPDHIDYKSGFGCTVRLAEGKQNAYTDHEKFLVRTKKEQESFMDFEKFDW
eukprot:augustus_masked-scaffold_6-processed-gene-2.39-mRNA-1 protein AED:1.00 eAED:1.00 QI:0/-1/0/0/-1/1/1/0/1232